MSRLDVILVGAGGFGGAYVKALLSDTENEKFNFKAVIDPYAEKATLYQNLKDANIPIYNTMEDFFSKEKCDLTLIVTPIHLHLEHCLTALKNGSHVLCEKPIVPLVSQISEIQKAAEENNRLVSVGFQLSFSDNMLKVKKAAMSGEYGRPLRFKTYVSWPRSLKYYSRGWAGKIFDENGNYILDSIITNSTAHYMHNMLFLLGEKINEAAEIDSIKAAAYRANNIEAFDTIALRGKTVSGCEILFIASHATNYKINPITICEFEKATIAINQFSQSDELDCVVHHKNGEIEDLGILLPNSTMNKILYTIDAINGEKELYCTPQTAAPHIRLINAIFDNVPINTFSEEFISFSEEPKSGVYVKNLHLDLYKCFEQYKLPSELGFSWSGKETEVNVRGFAEMRNLKS